MVKKHQTAPTSSSKRASMALGGRLEVKIWPREGLLCGVVARSRLSEPDPSGSKGMCRWLICQRQPPRCRHFTLQEYSQKVRVLRESLLGFVAFGNVQKNNLFKSSVDHQNYVSYLEIKREILWKYCVLVVSFPNINCCLPLGLFQQPLCPVGKGDTRLFHSKQHGGGGGGGSRFCLERSLWSTTKNQMKNA